LAHTTPALPTGSRGFVIIFMLFYSEEATFSSMDGESNMAAELVGGDWSEQKSFCTDRLGAEPLGCLLMMWLG
jgi:hypothetical protein